MQKWMSFLIFIGIIYNFLLNDFTKDGGKFDHSLPYLHTYEQDELGVNLYFLCISIYLSNNLKAKTNGKS